MFSGFARQWAPLLPSGEVTGQARGVRLAGENLVTWRDGSGRAVVLLDRCPHRGVALSLGNSTGDGALACAFHGWEFGGDGGCRHVPFNPDAPLHRLGATPVPVTEAAGFVWVFSGFEPVGAPVFPEALDDGDLARGDHWEEWDCHWTRAMENMLDFPHLPYVHRTTIGRFVRSKQKRDSRLHLDLTDTAYGFTFATRVDEHPPGASLSWYRPCGMMLDTVPGPKMMRLHVWCVPIDEHKTRMILTSLRNFALNPAASIGVNRFNLVVLHQDRDVVESSDPPVVPAGPAERSVPTDNPTLRFRTWYHRELAGTDEPDPRVARLSGESFPPAG